MTTTKKLFDAVATSSGGKNGKVTSPDGFINMNVRNPKETGGDGQGTNPEQLFSAGFAACFESALMYCATKQKIDLGPSAVTCVTTLNRNDAGVLSFAVKMEVSLPKQSRGVAERLVHEAEKVCPWSHSTDRRTTPVEIIVKENR